MIHLKKPVRFILLCCLCVSLLLGAGLTAMAASNSTSSAEASSDAAGTDSTPGKTKPEGRVSVSTTSLAASVLGKTEDEIKASVTSGTSIGQQLKDANKLDAFRTVYLAAYKTRLDEAVKAGTLTQSKADEKYASKQKEIAAWDGSTELSKGGKGRGGNGKDSARVSVVQVAASVLGKTEDEIRESVKSGKVGDLLIAAGKVDDFKTAYLAELKSKLDAAVSGGTLTEAEADEKYTAGKEKMDSYDGTTHLCGGNDHSKMFGKRDTSNTGNAVA